MWVREPGRDETRERPRKNHEQRDPKAPCQHDEIGDDTESFPSALMIAALKVPKEYRYEHNRQRPRRQKVIQKIRQRETREVEVGLSAGAQRAADDLFAHQTHNAAKKN
jgi:hypothetical protein